MGLGNKLAGKLGDKIFGESKFSDTLDEVPLYDDFFSNILSDQDNAITEGSYWVVFFTSTGSPTAVGNDGYFGGTALGQMANKFVSDKFGISKQSPEVEVEKLSKESHPWTFHNKGTEALSSFFSNIKNTVMLVQGIEIPGDGFSVTRPDTFNVGGMLRAPITGIRNDMPELEITFLENNSSVTDLVIRPWVIESSYKSLKSARRATIDCFNITRSPTGFRVRKHWKFFNAVPISVDSEQYSYTPSTSYIQRQTRFVFTDYSLTDGEAMGDGLFSKLKGMVRNKLEGAVAGVIESGVDLVAGGAGRVLTNIKGSFVDTLNDHVQDFQSRVRDYGNNAESSIIDGAQRLIDKTIGFNPDKDSLQGPGTEFDSAGVDNNPSPRIEVVTKSGDSMDSPPTPPRSTKVVNDVTYDIRDINGNDVVKLEDTISTVRNELDGNDTPDVDALQTAINIINSGDSINNGDSINYEVRLINKDDTPNVNALNIQEVVISNNGAGISTTPISIPDDDI